VTDVKTAFNGAVTRAKIQNFRFHDLRHTFCSWLALRGVPLAAIQKLAGHASIKITLRYAHLSPRYLADEVKALDKYHTEEATDGIEPVTESPSKEPASPDAKGASTADADDSPDSPPGTELQEANPAYRLHRCAE